MLDIGWMEMLVVAVVALLVIGPKDLPGALRTVGHWVGKVKGIAREFQNSVDDMIQESELEEYRQGVQKIASGDLDDDWDRQMDPTGSDDGPFAGPTGVEAMPRTAPSAQEMLTSESETATDDVGHADKESEVAGERPAAGSESTRTGT